MISRSTASVFQSTPPARGATTVTEKKLRTELISIHAPREGGDIHRERMFRC